MTTIEIRHQLHQVIDEMPEDKLNDVLIYINGLKSGLSVDEKRSRLLKNILDEDQELLKRLAQ